MNINDLPQMNDEKPEIYRLLKIGEYSVAPSDGNFEIIHNDESSETKTTSTQISKIVENSKISETVSKFGTLFKPAKGLLIYPAVFGASFLFFYTTMNFPSIAAQASGMFASKTQDQQILGSDLAAYNSWISGYFYAVSDKTLLAADNDYDHDGLTNYDEFILHTNPTVSDSDSDGISDGVEILNSTNPWGSGSQTADQAKLREGIDVNMVSERLNYDVSANQGKPVSSTDSANFDLSKPGILSIPKLNISAPFIFSQDTSDFENDLEHGVIHYPGTALPGETGTMYVSGHSSDYIWKHDKFATIFTKINFLTPGDDIFVTVYGKDGKVYNYRYQVTGQKVYTPDDQTQFIDNSSAILNLSTCWPIGTAKNRMVVTAKLTSL